MKYGPYTSNEDLAKALADIPSLYGKNLNPDDRDAIQEAATRLRELGDEE